MIPFLKRGANTHLCLNIPRISFANCTCVMMQQRTPCAHVDENTSPYLSTPLESAGNNISNKSRSAPQRAVCKNCNKTYISDPFELDFFSIFLHLKNHISIIFRKPKKRNKNRY